MLKQSQRSCASFSTDSRDSFMEVFSNVSSLLSKDVLATYPAVSIIAQIGAFKTFGIDTILSTLSGDDTIKQQREHSYLEDRKCEAVRGWVQTELKTIDGNLLGIQFKGTTKQFYYDEQIAQDAKDRLKLEFSDAVGGITFFTIPERVYLRASIPSDIQFHYERPMLDHLLGSSKFRVSGEVSCDSWIASQEELERLVNAPRLN